MWQRMSGSLRLGLARTASYLETYNNAYTLGISYGIPATGSKCFASSRLQIVRPLRLLLVSRGGGFGSSPDSMIRLSCLQNGSVRVSGENKSPMVTDSTQNTFYRSKKARFECNIMVIILSATIFVNDKNLFHGITLYTVNMPVHPITYVYLIFVISFLLMMVIAIFKRDAEKALTFFTCALLFLIGFSCNYQICPLWFCIGVQ